jgi:hypothetical protein
MLHESSWSYWVLLNPPGSLKLRIDNFTPVVASFSSTPNYYDEDYSVLAGTN